ncbi:IS3 family transposase [Salinispirillum marinum]|uniref:IS3 family transposase n=2 Tax=Saccharospirillaceae TaxID=255527 RepID=A0ABV8BFP8_9GAMM
MPKANLAKKTQQYSLEFKRKSVEMTFDPDVLIKDVALAMDIHPFMLSRWRKEYREGLLRPSRSKKTVSKSPRKAPTKAKPKESSSDESPELKRLRKENDKLKLENDLLKKATVSVGSTQDRYRFIARHGATHGVRYLCRWLKVSHSGYYDWKDRPDSQRQHQNNALRRRIAEIFSASKGRYGSPRIHSALQREGQSISRKRVARLMREGSMKARVARIYRRSPGTAKFFATHKNLLLGSPAPTAINQQWVGDLTYIKVGQKWRYLSVVMDKYSRNIISWRLSEEKTAMLTRLVLREAIEQRQPPEGLIFHTDRGVEYGAHEVQNLLKRHGIISSMNRPGCCTDNGYMESFFHSLKAELIHGNIYKTDHGLHAAVREYINDFYNPWRLHSGLGYQSPLEYEQRAA